MKIRFQLAWLVVGVALMVSRLVAQDVIVTDPAWFDPEKPEAELLPVFKNHPRLACPSEMKPLNSIECSTVARWVEVDGTGSQYRPVGSNQYLVEAFSKLSSKTKPAMKSGRPVRVLVWYAAIFNPKSANTKADDATPRVSRVSLVMASEEKIPRGQAYPFFIKAVLKLDAQGVVIDFSFENSVYESLRPEAAKALRQWQISPARKNGQPVVSEVVVPLVVVTPPRSLVEKRIQPKPLNGPKPVYPEAMAGSGFRGEVVVGFTVDTAGTVVNPVVVRSNNQGFDAAAIDAVRKMQFQSASEDGKPVVYTGFAQTIIFSVEGMLNGGGERWKIEHAADKKGTDSTARSAEYDVAPKIKTVVSPVYPYALLQKKISGLAEVSMMIDESGNVQAVNLENATHPEFGCALIAAAQAFRFFPATKAGRPTCAAFLLEQKFKATGANNFPADEDLKMLSKEMEDPQSILSAKKLDAPLKPISQKKPRFPLGLNVNEGQATVEVLVAKDGAVRLPRVVSASDPVFGYAAMQAVAAWRFEPPKAGGKPVVARVRIPVGFELEIMNKTPDTPALESRRL